MNRLRLAYKSFAYSWNLIFESSKFMIFLYFALMLITNTNLHRQREYLLPCFVADCCRESGIEGIKYYGSKEYKNYVSWDDSYFAFEGSEVQQIR